MPAETLNCPMCGAAASSEATRCEHCGARLATIACPSCFGMMFLGAKFCSHCGAKPNRTEVAAGTTEVCPRCRTALEKVLIGQTQLEECPRCEGVWADADAVRQICARQEEQAAVLGMATATTASPGISLDDRIHYIPCPACHDLMNRVNFAHCSNVIVNVCSRHGTWVDKDQLRRIVEFIRDGGLEKSRRAELEELEDRKRSLEAKVDLGAPAAGDWYDTNRHVGIQAAVSLIGSLFDL